MEKVFDVTLKGGVVSSVYFSTLLKDLENKIKSYGENVIYVCDDNTSSLINLDPDRTIILSHGEENKNSATLDKIIKKALSLSLARDSIFIAIGGGVVCDMTAFASSVYMRGARVVLVPTTLLAMTDASVGGKSGIDYMGYKNFIGSFYPAEDILICLETLKTLNDKEYLCGLGEVMKHALLSKDEEMFTFLDENKDLIMVRDLSAMYQMVKLSLSVKNQFIEADPEEKKGIRSFLNLGHTFGHALETITNYSISHGEGVAWGVKKALAISYKKGLCQDSFFSDCINLIDKYPFNINIDITKDEIPAFLTAISKDKKKSKGSVKFVLLKDFGQPVLLPLSDDEIVSVL